MPIDEIMPTKTVDGIACFKLDVVEDHADYDASILDDFYTVEKNNFWFIGRREKIISAFINYLVKPAYILEIGAGTGYVAKGLQNEGYRVAVADIHLSGLRYAREKGISECFQFDLFEPPFQEKFDAIGMFDVLEHLEDDAGALCQVSKMLKPGGRLIITVPAHQWLWNHDDVIASHKRRYSREMLVQKVEQVGYQVLESRFFFIVILPLLYIRHLVNKDSAGKDSMRKRITGIDINPMVNWLLLRLTRLENSLSKWLPNVVGGSLLIVAVKMPRKIE